MTTEGDRMTTEQIGKMACEVLTDDAFHLGRKAALAKVADRMAMWPAEAETVRTEYGVQAAYTRLMVSVDKLTAELRALVNIEEGMV